MVTKGECPACFQKEVSSRQMDRKVCSSEKSALEMETWGSLAHRHHLASQTECTFQGVSRGKADVEGFHHKGGASPQRQAKGSSARRRCAKSKRKHFKKMGAFTEG